MPFVTDFYVRGTTPELSPVLRDVCAFAAHHFQHQPPGTGHPALRL